MIKRLLAWLAIVLILAIFFYFSLNAYQLIKHDDAAEQPQIVSKEQPRTHVSELVTLLIIGAGIIYLIKREGDGSTE